MKKLILLALLPILMTACENSPKIVNENDIVISYQIVDKNNNECFEIHEGDSVSILCTVTNLSQNTIYYNNSLSYAGKEFGYFYNVQNDKLVTTPNIWLIDDFDEYGSIEPGKSIILIRAEYPEDYKIKLPKGSYYSKQKPEFAYYETNNSDLKDKPIIKKKTSNLTVNLMVL